jgi:hypothetical protein
MALFSARALAVKSKRRTAGRDGVEDPHLEANVAVVKAKGA